MSELNSLPENHRRLSVLKTFLSILSIFVISRITVIGFGYLGYRYSHSTVASFYHIFCQWDCGWYNYIINHGYEAEPIPRKHESSASWAFFPLFPLIIRYSRQVFDFFNPYTDFLIVNSLLLAALCIFYKYQRLENNKESSIFCILLIAFSPYSIYFSIPYTESLSLLLTVLVFYLAKKEKWEFAGLVAALLSSVKVIGVLIVFPLLLIAIKKYNIQSLLRLKPGAEKVIFSFMIAPLGLFLYMLYLYHHVGDAFAFKHVQIAWLRQVGNPFDILFNGFKNPLSINFYYAIISLTGLCCTAYLFKRGKFPEATLLGMALLIPLSTRLVSMPRYTFGLFPIYIAIEMLTRKTQSLRYLVLALFAACSVFTAIAWTNGKGFMT